MLNIYYGRDSIDKEKYVYTRIRQRGYGPSQRTLVIVPDQYTLEAERSAMKLLQTNVLLGLDVYSISHLGNDVLKEVGTGRLTFVDQYGRQMLLTRILREEGDSLEVFSGSRKRDSLVTMMNDFISQMKQYGISPEVLAEVLKDVPEEGILHRKLSDMHRIYSRYEELIAGKYTDSEDYIDRYVEGMRRSRLISGSRIWVYGFDSFAPKALDALQAMMSAAESVNVVLTNDVNCRDEELFTLTSLVMRNLEERAGAEGVEIGEVQKIPQEDSGVSFVKDKRAEGLTYLEKELFVPAPEAFHGRPDGVILTEAANPHNEAESAAAFILHLIRDCGYRYRDIAVVCNDQENRGVAAARVFEEYGLPLFIDKKRSILDSPAAVCVVSMLQAVENRWNSRDIVCALKSGLSDFSTDEIEALENYAIKYRIRGTMWKNPFIKGDFEYTEEGLASLNALRERVAALFGKLENICKNAETTEDFLKAFYLFLTEDLRIEERLDRLMQLQNEEGFQTAADETQQVWSMMVGLFDQIAVLMGSEPFSAETFIELFTAGLKGVEVGVLPSSVDDLVMGTMQRTRTSSVRALIVIGANEGLLPANGASDGMFGADELESLAEIGHQICKLDSVRVQEEKLAMYRNFSAPSDVLWVSWSNSGTEGSTERRSEIIGLIQDVFPDLPIERDILSRSNPEAMIAGKKSTLRHLTAELNAAARKHTAIDPIWRPVQSWYEKNMPEEAAALRAGLRFDNAPQAVDPRMTDLFFQKRHGRPGERLTLSPSRLEKYARCPFAYYVQYGLAPSEQRIYEAGSREIGDLYHRCILDITSELSRKNIWKTVTEEECEEFVNQAIRAESERYRDGLFRFGKQERYRTSRLKKACMDTLNALITHVREGNIDTSRFEVRFGEGADIRPIEIELEDGLKVFIEGQIDRLDVLENGRLKVIDYKSGNRKLNIPDIRAGFSLQLMLYMQAAEEGTRKPAGVFYFHIAQPRVSGDSLNLMENSAEVQEELRQRLKEAFRMNGLLVNEPETVREITGINSFDDEETRKNSDIVESVRYSVKKRAFSGKSMITEEEFAELQEDVQDTVTNLIEKLHKGCIDINPMKTSKENACEYCEFRSICRFDRGFSGNKYNIVKSH